MALSVSAVAAAAPTPPAMAPGQPSISGIPVNCSTCDGCAPSAAAGRCRPYFQKRKAARPRSNGTPRPTPAPTPACSPVDRPALPLPTPLSVVLPAPLLLGPPLPEEGRVDVELGRFKVVSTCPVGVVAESTGNPKDNKIIIPTPIDTKTKNKNDPPKELAACRSSRNFQEAVC